MTLPRPPIFVISLPETVQRRTYIREHLSQLGLEFEIVDAVDGRALSESQSRLYDPERAKEMLGRELVAGEVGCALSHLGLYQRMLEENITEALIVEDDCVMSSYLLEVLDRRERLPANWNVVLLSHSGFRGSSKGAEASYWDRRPIHQHYRCVHFVEKAWLTSCYLIRESGAARLVEHGYPVRVPADHLTGDPDMCGIRLYGIRPACAGSHPEFGRHTTMADRRRLDSEWEAKRLANPNLSLPRRMAIAANLHPYYGRAILEVQMLRRKIARPTG